MSDAASDHLGFVDDDVLDDERRTVEALVDDWWRQLATFDDSTKVDLAKKWGLIE